MTESRVCSSVIPAGSSTKRSATIGAAMLKHLKHARLRGFRKFGADGAENSAHARHRGAWCSAIIDAGLPFPNFRKVVIPKVGKFYRFLKALRMLEVQGPILL